VSVEAAARALGVMTDAFDYGSLSPEDTESFRGSAQRIRSLIDKGNAVIAQLGVELIGAKAKLPHGQFARWVEAEFDVSDRTALNYMRFAEWAGGKSELVSILQPNTVYLLAAPSTPQSVQAEVIDRIRSGETLTATAIKTMVSKAKEQAARIKREEKKATRIARLSPKERKAVESREARRQRREAERIAEDARVRRALGERDQRTKDAAVFLRDRLGSELSRFAAMVEDISWHRLRDLLKTQIVGDEGG
jgi:hypothetical protein